MQSRRRRRGWKMMNCFFLLFFVCGCRGCSRCYALRGRRSNEKKRKRMQKRTKFSRFLLKAINLCDSHVLTSKQHEENGKEAENSPPKKETSARFRSKQYCPFFYNNSSPIKNKGACPNLKRPLNMLDSVCCSREVKCRVLFPFFIYSSK